MYRSIARYFAGSITVALLNGTVILTSGLILGIPLAPLAGHLGGDHQPHPADRRLPRWIVLRAARLHRQPDERRDRALASSSSYQQLENHVIQPTIIGRAVHLTPPTTMLAALIGGAAAGVPGALVATPLIGAAKSVWLDVVAVDDP